jgi:hypothetical protein
MKDPRLDRPPEPGCPSGGHFERKTRAAIGRGRRPACCRANLLRAGGCAFVTGSHDPGKVTEERENVVDGGPFSLALALSGTRAWH